MKFARALAHGHGRVWSLVALTAVTWIVFSVFGRGFLSAFNLNSLSQIIGQSIVIGFAQAALLVLGRINLAVGGIGVVVVAAIGLMVTFTPIPLPLVLLIALAIGGAAGALMAVVELYSKLNSFVVTLAFLSIYQGGVLLLTQAAHFPIASPVLLALGNGQALLPAISPLLVLALIVAVLLWFFYFRTSPGWQSLAVGANERAAAASGLRVRRIVILGYVLSGLLCGIAAIMETSRLAEASPSTGSDWLLLSFIGPLLAGVALSGGNISIGGIVIGSVFYGSIFSGLVILNVPTYWLTFAQAAVLLVALIVGQLRLGSFTRFRPSRSTRERTAAHG
jgi:ribose/xylose/arabinose/galactoside ABC-type transport system permease subunit